MASLNKVMLIGRLTADPEAPRTLPNSGNTVVKFRMAVGRSKKNPQTGQWENDPNPMYIDCEVFSSQMSKRNLPDVVTRFVKRGDQIFVEGRLQLDTWDDKATGAKRSKHKIVVDSIELLGGKSDGGGDGGSYGGAVSQQAARSGGGYSAPAGGPPDDGGEPPENDDIPF